MTDHVHSYVYPALICEDCGETVYADEVQEIIESRPLFGIRGRNPFVPSYADVTHRLMVGDVDEESLPIKRCICGTEFKPWDFVISIYKKEPIACPICDRKFYFTNKITIYQVFESKIEESHG